LPPEGRDGPEVVGRKELLEGGSLPRVEVLVSLLKSVRERCQDGRLGG